MAAAPLDRVAVVLGARADEIVAAVPLHGAEPVVCDGWAEGIGASLRAGVDALAGCEAIVVALGDQPRLSPEAVARLVAARGGGAPALRASYGGVPGHPVLVEASLFDRLRAVRGDEGARAVLAEVEVRDVPCDGLGSPRDVDTPEQLARLA
jgi:CTP:molybdopterin cytidylyltransferase MocA